MKCCFFFSGRFLQKYSHVSCLVLQAKFVEKNNGYDINDNKEENIAEVKKNEKHDLSPLIVTRFASRLGDASQSTQVYNVIGLLPLFPNFLKQDIVVSLRHLESNSMSRIAERY